MYYQLVKPRTDQSIRDELIVQFDCAGYSAMTQDKFIGSDCLMQYTGLKDKNGKEIYEGDLISEEMIDDEGNSIGFTQENFTLIGWRDYGFVYILNPFSKEEFSERFFEEEIEDGKLNCIVVGNIYENPKLLTND